VGPPGRLVVLSGALPAGLKAMEDFVEGSRRGARIELVNGQQMREVARLVAEHKAEVRPACKVGHGFRRP
jgi:hypothetical protein